jgi:hypothetical protein
MFTFYPCQKDNTVYNSIKKLDLDDKTNCSVSKDEIMVIKKDGKSMDIRRVVFWDSNKERVYENITHITWKYPQIWLRISTNIHSI